MKIIPCMLFHVKIKLNAIFQYINVNYDYFFFFNDKKPRAQYMFWLFFFLDDKMSTTRLDLVVDNRDDGFW